MHYRHTEDQNWEDYAAGRVLRNFPGQAVFVVRLASELFQRAFQLWQQNTGKPRCVLFDPLCGGAYHLAVLGLLHSELIAEIIAADIDDKALELAALNLRLLQPPGMRQRKTELEALYAAHGKASHQEALRSLAILSARQQHAVPFRLAQGDAFDERALKTGAGSTPMDIVFSDLPYGMRSQWQGEPQEDAWAERYLGALLPLLRPESVVILVADKEQTLRHSGYQRSEHLRLGKRQAVLLRPRPSGS